MQHQDWKTVYIKSNKTTHPHKHKSQQTYNVEKHIENNIDNGKMKIQKVDREKSLSIQQKRLSKGLTQKDLANKLNIPIKILNDIESGKGSKNSQILNKINNFLNK